MIYGIHIGDYHNLVHHIKETHKLTNQEKTILKKIKTTN